MLDKNQSNKTRIKILLPLPFFQAFDYCVPISQKVPEIGSFIQVPFGNRIMTGVAWSLDSDSALPDSKIKNFIKVLDSPPLKSEILQFIQWVADWTLFPLGSVLKMAMSVEDAFYSNHETTGYVLGTIPEKGRLTTARKKVLEVATNTPLLASELANLAGVSASVVKGLAEMGALDKKPIQPIFFQTPDTNQNSVCLSDEQTIVADNLSATVDNGFSVNVLNGVTGSGKTEVYFDVVAKALNQGKQIVVLLPEIGLTGQWLERFERRFKTKPALWHSGLSQRVRRQTWKGVLSGEIKVLAGARSALFLPFQNLGAIIVDEEHDASFKQEEGVVYHARDMAIVRAKIEKIPVILSSATPSLETKINIQQGKFNEFILPYRYGKAVLPDINLIDMRKNPPIDTPEDKSFLSPVLVNALQENLDKKEQSLLFLNRRGYAPLVLCRSCGHRFQCPHCSAWLVEHRYKNSLECHHCGYRISIPKKCPVCDKEDTLTSCGPGVERISQEISNRFPNASQIVLTSDSNLTAVEMAEKVRQIHNNEIDIVIGTQLLTKGHHFPNLTVVGVIDADLGLSGGDLRAGERTYQMLSQVAGRAGRAEKKGTVFLQTFDPENQIMQALQSGDSENFFNAEIMSRELLKMPPFGRLAGIVVSAKSEQEAFNAANYLGKIAPNGNGVRVLGPTPAPLALLRGKYRFRLLLQTTRNVKIQDVLKNWLSDANLPNSIRVQTDIDPYSFF